MTLSRIVKLYQLTSKYLIDNTTYFDLAKNIYENKSILNKVLRNLYATLPETNNELALRLILQSGLEKSKLFDFTLQVKGKFNGN